MSLRTLEPWERRLWADRKRRGKEAAQSSSTLWCSMSPLQLRQEIAGLEADFKANWKQIAFLHGHLQVVDDRFRGRKPVGASLKGYLEADKSRSLKEWL